MWSTLKKIGGVIIEKDRIVSEHRRQFLSLTLLFILPLYLSVLLYFYNLNLLVLPNSDDDNSKLIPTHTSIYTSQHLIKSLSLLPLVFVLFQLAVATFTYTAYQGYYRRPLNLLSTTKSLFLRNFIPLFPTLIFGNVAFGFFAAIAIKGLNFLDFDIIASVFNIGSAAVLSSLLAVVGLVYVQLNWSVASVVVVVEESKWGLEALGRSWYLVGGEETRWVCYWLSLNYGLGSGVYLWLGGGLLTDGGYWGSWWMMMMAVCLVIYSADLMVQGLVAMTVFYIKCKEIHGELANDNASSEEIAGYHVNVPLVHGP